jgi:hypothetical protein
MPIKYQKMIYRADLKANPTQIYVFGDNVLREGYGGQAKEMRGELNAIGVATKWAPDNQAGSFFNDDPICFNEVAADMAKVYALLQLGVTVVVPQDGIGTGLSRLPELAPNLDRQIKDAWGKMECEFNA